MGSNYEAVYKTERKRVVRCFHRYTSEQRADLASSFRLGHRQRQATGRFFYIHPDVPGLAFDTRKRATEAAMTGKGESIRTAQP